MSSRAPRFRGRSLSIAAGTTGTHRAIRCSCGASPTAGCSTRPTPSRRRVLQRRVLQLRLRRRCVHLPSRGDRPSWRIRPGRPVRRDAEWRHLRRGHAHPRDDQAPHEHVRPLRRPDGLCRPGHCFRRYACACRGSGTGGGAGPLRRFQGRQAACPCIGSARERSASERPCVAGAAGVAHAFGSAVRHHQRSRQDHKAVHARRDARAEITGGDRGRRRRGSCGSHHGRVWVPR